MLDHRASPGFTPEEARALGYSDEASGEKLYEAKTNHCSHCGTVVIMNPHRTRERSYCQACNKYICDNCGIAMRLQTMYIKLIFNNKKILRSSFYQEHN